MQVLQDRNPIKLTKAEMRFIEEKKRILTAGRGSGGGTFMAACLRF